MLHWKTIQFIAKTLVSGAFYLSGCELPAVKTFEMRPSLPPQPGAPGGDSRGATSVPVENSPQPDNAKHWIQIAATHDTFFKIQNVDSTALLSQEKCLLPRGTRHSLSAAPEWIGSHMKVTLKQPMAGCPFTTGWVYTAHVGESSDQAPEPEQKTHTTQTTLYTTENTPIEGGPKDRCGRKLNTLDDYMNWKAEEVSVAMDRLALPYGTLIRIPEIERRLKVSDPIPFRVVDTGSAFIGKGFSRMDICVGHNQETIFSSKYVWMSHGTFEFQVLSLGKSFDCY